MLAMRTIAIVGASPDPDRPSHGVMHRLIELGLTCIPVNPHATSVLGQTCYPTLADIPVKVELVCVFRRSEACPEIAQQAADVDADGLWLQSGIRCKQCAHIAEAAGMWYVEDHCLAVAHSLR